MNTFSIASVRENPNILESSIAFFQDKWADTNSMKMYEHAISSSLHSDNFFPQWFVGTIESKIMACCGIINNDFISRGDLYPWLCALYVEEEYRGNGYARKMIAHAKSACKNAGFKKLYLCTHLEDFYERVGFSFLDYGYHPWGEKSRIYESLV